MKKALILASSLALAHIPAALADQIVIDAKEHCTVDLKHTTQVSSDFFLITHNDAQRTLHYRAAKPDELEINGQVIRLDSKQQNQLEAYHAGLYQSGRDLAHITIDAVDIAMTGVGIALTALAGADHPDAIEFEQSAAEIREETRERVRALGDTYVLGEDWGEKTGGEIERTIEEMVEQELEPRIEKIAMESAGSIAWHALKAVFTGGASIEHDAEHAAEAASAVVEQRAEALASRAENMCHNLAVMDTIEADLQAANPELAAFDIIERDKH